MVQFLKCTPCASHERDNMNLIFSGNVSASAMPECCVGGKRKTWKKVGHSPFDKMIAKSLARATSSNFKRAVEWWWRWSQILTQNPNTPLVLLNWFGFFCKQTKKKAFPVLPYRGVKQRLSEPMFSDLESSAVMSFWPSSFKCSVEALHNWWCKNYMGNGTCSPLSPASTQRQ